MEIIQFNFTKKQLSHKIMDINKKINDSNGSIIEKIYLRMQPDALFLFIISTDITDKYYTNGYFSFIFVQFVRE